jgi:hypothetical protein
LPALAIALFAILAQAFTVQAQSKTHVQVRDSSDAHYVETAPGGTGPALLTLADVAGMGATAAGGLWLSGDTNVWFRYLRWIAGDQPAGLLKLDSNGRVSFDLRMLVHAAGTGSEYSGDQRARVASFVRSDEGLRLLAEVTEGPYRYLLHIGPVAPTLGGKIDFVVPCNFDNRFDSRINPRRPNGRKLDTESPPEGFDSLVAINSDARWFNLYSSQLIPMPQLAFHELAEAHARLVLGYDYLPQGKTPGAHDTAIDREIRLKKQRPGQNVALPVGSNLRLVSRQDWQWLFSRLLEQKEAESLRSLLDAIGSDPVATATVGQSTRRNWARRIGAVMK